LEAGKVQKMIIKERHCEILIQHRFEDGTFVLYSLQLSEVEVLLKRTMVD
jgi:hypothetical protein